MADINQLSEFIRSLYRSNDFIPLHAPTFDTQEKYNVLQTIESTFVSSVGAFVEQFEQQICQFTGSPSAIATVNGTAALHTSLHLAGVQANDLVITQALTFVATCNAIYHMEAEPVFIDVSEHTLGLCPHALESFLTESAVVENSQCIHKISGRILRAMVPMHTFGHPAQLDELKAIANRWNIILIEDAAESLGSFYKQQHTGTIGDYAGLSFNGNKIITTGGGGMVLCADTQQAKRAKHITTTAKVPHAYEFIHDEAGFNYRLPNLNAALGCAQMDKLPRFLKEKRWLAAQYREFFTNSDYLFIDEPEHCQSNFWLNAVICEDKRARDHLLNSMNGQEIMCRPVWQLMHRLPMYKHCLRGNLSTSERLEARLVNIPSTPTGIF